MRPTWQGFVEWTGGRRLPFLPTFSGRTRIADPLGAWGDVHGSTFNSFSFTLSTSTLATAGHMGGNPNKAVRKSDASRQAGPAPPPGGGLPLNR